MLHCCCAPCASSVIERLIPDYDITLLFYNPNIEPAGEYEKRKSDMPVLLQKASLLSEVKLLVGEYDNAAFDNAALSLRNEPEGRKRCQECITLRLMKTAQRAKAGEYDIFTTTLSVSPHKNARLINEIGRKLEKEYDIKYLVSDFKKQDGYKRSVELSKEYELYRQDYCGCKGV